MDSFWSFNSKILPAPSLTADPTPVVQLVDPVLYTLANFFAQLLNTNLQPRFGNEAIHCGLTHNSLDNWKDGYAVAQITDFPLHNLTLKDNDFKFPHLNIVIEHEEPYQITLTNSGISRDFCVSWVLPPLTSRQYNRLYQFLGETSKIWTGYGQQGYDPKVNTNSVWAACNVSFGSLNSVEYEHFYGFDKVGQDADFPSVQFRLTLVEQQQLPVPQNYPNKFSGATIQLNLVDGYNPANPIENFIDGYVYPNLTVASASLNSGTANGGTWFYLYGTGFDSRQLSSVHVVGATAAAFAVQSPTVLLVITSPAIFGTTGQTGDIVVTDKQGNAYTLSNSFTYI